MLHQASIALFKTTITEHMPPAFEKMHIRSTLARWTPSHFQNKPDTIQFCKDA